MQNGTYPSPRERLMFFIYVLSTPIAFVMEDTLETVKIQTRVVRSPWEQFTYAIVEQGKGGRNLEGGGGGRRTVLHNGILSTDIAHER